MKVSRRSFIKRTAVNTAGIASIPMIISSCMTDEKVEAKEEYTMFSENDVVLFQGDSITDAGREKKNQMPNNGGSFGGGYALMTASVLLEQMPLKNLTVYNRGISGNKVHQLDARWNEDCLDLKPQVMSILIGVNDYWHKRNGNYEGDVAVYENDFRALLKRTKEALPDIQLVICEPFSVDGGKAIGEAWQEEFKPYREAAKKLSDEFKTLHVPYQQIFEEALNFAPATYWCPDGVHPSMAGAQLMAQAWLNVVK